MSSSEAIDTNRPVAEQSADEAGLPTSSETAWRRREAPQPRKDTDEHEQPPSAEQVGEGSAQGGSHGSSRSRSDSRTNVETKGPPDVSKDSNKIKQRTSQQITEQSREGEGRATSAPMPASTAPVSERSARKRRANSSPRSSTGELRPSTLSEKETFRENRGDKPTASSHAQSSDEAEGVRRSEPTEETAVGVEHVTPSKRTKSDIAPWMTARHKRAIRRSLEAAAASSSPAKTPDEKVTADKDRRSQSDSEVQ